ncbi:MAG: hypothetical protein WC644_04875 [Ignavibacteria bacterium]
MNKILLNVFLWLALSLIVSSCGAGWKELKPVSNEKGLRIDLEITREKSKSEDQGAFALRITNNSDSDFIRCSLRFDDKHEHTFEGLKDKTGDVAIPLTRSILKSRDTFIFIFSSEVENYQRFGIKDEKKNYIPKKIELITHEGNLVWNVPDDLL